MGSSFKGNALPTHNTMVYYRWNPVHTACECCLDWGPLLTGADRRKVVIRQDAFGGMLTVRFPYAAANVKFHWIVFELHSSVRDDFNWVFAGNVVMTGNCASFTNWLTAAKSTAGSVN